MGRQRRISYSHREWPPPEGAGLYVLDGIKHRTIKHLKEEEWGEHNIF